MILFIKNLRLFPKKMKNGFPLLKSKIASQKNLKKYVYPNIFMYRILLNWFHKYITKINENYMRFFNTNYHEFT